MLSRKISKPVAVLAVAAFVVAANPPQFYAHAAAGRSRGGIRIKTASRQAFRGAPLRLRAPISRRIAGGSRQEIRAGRAWTAEKIAPRVRVSEVPGAVAALEKSAQALEQADLKSPKFHLAETFQNLKSLFTGDAQEDALPAAVSPPEDFSDHKAIGEALESQAVRNHLLAVVIDYSESASGKKDNARSILDAVGYILKNNLALSKTYLNYGATVKPVDITSADLKRRLSQLRSQIRKLARTDKASNEKLVSQFIKSVEKFFPFNPYGRPAAAPEVKLPPAPKAAPKSAAPERKSRFAWLAAGALAVAAEPAFAMTEVGTALNQLPVMGYAATAAKTGLGVAAIYAISIGAQKLISVTLEALFGKLPDPSRKFANRVTRDLTWISAMIGLYLFGLIPQALVPMAQLAGLGIGTFTAIETVRFVLGGFLRKLNASPATINQYVEMTVLAVGFISAGMTMALIGPMLSNASQTFSPATTVTAGILGGLPLGLTLAPFAKQLLDGMTLFFSQPFKVGDKVAVGSPAVTGTVEMINPHRVEIKEEKTQATVVLSAGDVQTNAIRILSRASENLLR
ncbi:MAG: mechanosensitive ion channel [Elusimicrobia bacterium]|nr:mechanosensitive ion channel [Elusimicrobiota bacterium]